MNATGLPPRISLGVKRARWLVLWAGLIVSSLSAQVTNIWSVKHPPGFSATYFDNADLTNPKVTRFHRFIDFDWNGFLFNGSPDPSIHSNTFSARWTGRVMPFYSENYTFHGVADDGIRVWINDQLVIDAWFDQVETEHSSAPIPLTAGVEFTVRIEYYQNTGAARTRFLWSSPSQAKEVVRYLGGPAPSFFDTHGYSFGAPMTALSGGRFVVASKGAEEANIRQPGFFFATSGFGWIYDQAGQARGYARTMERRLSYGRALVAFPDGRFLASALISNVGVVFLHDANGNALRSWTNPEGTTNGEAFGAVLGALGGNRFAASSSNKVYIFDAGSPNPPLVTITNPTPATSTFWFFEGYLNLAGLGSDRILIPTRSNDASTYRLLLYNLNGTPLGTIPSPGQSDGFGWVVRPVDDHRFLVSAPQSRVSYFEGGQFITNSIAGLVYLVDDTGALLRTFTPPNIPQSRNFGVALSLLGPSRVLIGAPYDLVNSTTVGRVFLYNIDGAHLSTMEGPIPAGQTSDSRFGTAIEALDGRRFVVGAPSHDLVYGFDIPIPELELGSEIPRPTGVDASGIFPMQGPTVSPSGSAFWHIPSGKLFAVKPGGIRVTWPLLGGQSNNWEASLIWPTNASRYQTYVAGQAAVDLSNGGTFLNATLHATTTDADPTQVSQARRFSATVPGLNLLMLSAGSPASNAIRFQLVESIEWQNPAYLHDNAPATVGQPIVDPGGYFDPAGGSPQVILPTAIYCPAPVFDPATRTGTIIPVNVDNPANPADDLVVAYYQRGSKLFDPVTGSNIANSIFWPAKPVRFAPTWPAGAPHLVIASQQGTGVIDPAQHVEWQLYYQNGITQPGFNPNDEHALRLPYSGGEAVFALRDDLGTPTTSQPYVLIRYRDPAAGLAWRIKTWRVVAEESPYFFRYPARAGQLIQAPFPLSTLAVAPQSTGVSGPHWRDRKLFFWARAAGDDGGTAEIVMRYFYPVQTGFSFPQANPPQPGTNVPLLDVRAGTPGTPINIRYDTTWPTDVPDLRVNETLVKPKNGLPQIAGQTSAEIIYDQSVVRTQVPSVELIDPVRIRSVSLSQLPSDITTRNRAGVLYFPALPPSLETRVSYDPVARRLRFAGEFVEPPAGEAYLLLNVLTSRDRAFLTALSTDTAWQSAVAGLATQAANVIPVPPDSTGFDSLALTAGRAGGTGYVTIAFGNSTNLSAPADPISLNIIRVTCPVYRGELKVIESPNPLAEQLTLRHSGDFAGDPSRFVFEWRTLPPVDGLPSPAPPEQWAPFSPNPATGLGAVDITVAGPGLYTLSDNYFICRYRRENGTDPCGGNWSSWTPPMLAEGWIKRVLAGIGPFEQRIQDYQDTQVNTIVSMISQAGARALGDIALNLDAVNQSGLIEVYETVLRRGMNLSVEGAPPVDYPPANDALLLAAGRLADLYMLLGNEAYADAADPTIAFGTDDGIYGSQATSIHCFMNQTGSLLEEELGLLRGRDNSKLPSVQTHPFHNRFIWNFTRDITGGEVAYALNYNIRNGNGDVAGAINEADARRLYPQGHGDAWGHYLTAIKNYYRLLRNPNFTWVPRIEAIVVGGVPVSVDYLDERKFAAAAAARARTGAEIVNLTLRDTYAETPSRPWQDPNDANAERAWSSSDWANRAGQGAFIDWVVANAILPDVDTNPSHTGIQKIERGTIRELPEIAEAFAQIQNYADQADNGRNPLALARNAVPFDIDPGGIASGKTHFEQINERANEALKNAVAVFDHANASTQLLRRQADAANEFQQRVIESEADFNNRLIEIFGTPYAEDIGPTGTYPTGYTGPDIYHYDYVDAVEIQGSASALQNTIQLALAEIDVNGNGTLSKTTRAVRFHFSPNGFGLEKPPAWTQRSAPGELQMSRSSVLESIRRLERGVVEYENLVGQIEDAAQSFQAEFRLNARQIDIRDNQYSKLQTLNDEIAALRSSIFNWEVLGIAARAATDYSAEILPRVAGFAFDPFSHARALIYYSMRTATVVPTEIAILTRQDSIADKQDEKNEIAALTELNLATAQAAFTHQERLRQLEQLIRSERVARLELAALAESQQQTSSRYLAALGRGLRVLEERTRFRQQTASQIQSYRYKDMAFRIFRSDALQKYRAQFDLAARYAYLAAKAYDYETCLAPNDPRGPGSAFLTGIVRSRALGRFSDGVPLPGGSGGDPGIADPLARMTANWNLVLKGQLGFNNPQTETGRFSLRNELFRVLTGPGGTQRWRETLERHVVPNVLAMPEFQRHCIPFSPTQPAEPAIVIPFGTTINFGLNFFGWPAGGGDNDYDSTKFATRIRSVGVWFANYNNLGGGMINTPRVYLIPVGLDVMRAPTQGNIHIRDWRILDQALPVPFPLNGSVPNNLGWIPLNDTLLEDFASIRRFGRFRAFHDSGSFNPAETVTDTRLVGRSVWNSRWLLIIPAGTLHTDRTEGIQRFIHGALRPDGTRDGNGVSDIKIFFQTYAYSGN